MYEFASYFQCESKLMLHYQQEEPAKTPHNTSQRARAISGVRETDLAFFLLVPALLTGAHTCAT